MSVEVAGAALAGALAGSIALLAFGADSLVELISAIAVVGHLRTDAGGSEAQGHMVGRFTAVLMIALVPIIGVSAILSYLYGLKPEGSPLGIVIALGAVMIMPHLWLQKRRIGEETRCLPLSVDALASATCLLMSVALLGGLLAESLYGLWWGDYLATALILAFIWREAAESYREVAFKVA